MHMLTNIDDKLQSLQPVHVKECGNDLSWFFTLGLVDHLLTDRSKCQRGASCNFSGQCSSNKLFSSIDTPGTDIKSCDLNTKLATDLLDSCQCRDSIVKLIFDTTALMWLGCRHHIGEIITPYSSFLDKSMINNDGIWGGDVEIMAASTIFEVDILVANNEYRWDSMTNFNKLLVGN